jgi:site-specific DNA recombinase
VAIYLRVSTVDQGRRGFSLGEQRKECLQRVDQLVREAGRPLEVAEFVDTAGGDIIHRPELDRVRRYVKERAPDYFVCMDPDRFSRATYQAIMVANEIEAAGTRLLFVQHDYQSTSEGRLFFTLRVAIAEYEKAKILERTALGKRGKMARGGIPHGLRIYGYDYLPQAQRQLHGGDAGPLVPNEAEAAWVRRIFGWAAEERLGSQRIAERLNELGVPAKHGGPWRRNVVAAMLHNPTYAGRLRLHRYDFTGLGSEQQLPPDRRTRKLTPRQRPEADWVTVAVPPLVEEALFAAAQGRLAGGGERRLDRPARPVRLLSGLVGCGLCGRAMHYAWSARCQAYLLRCPGRFGGGCTQRHWKAGPVEAQVWQQATTWLVEEGALAEYAVHQAAAGNELPGQLTRELEAARRGQTQLVALAARGTVTAEVVEPELARLQARIRVLEEQTATVAPALEANGPLEWLHRLARLAPEQRRTVLQLLMETAWVDGDGAVRVVPRV